MEYPNTILVLLLLPLMMLPSSITQAKRSDVGRLACEGTRPADVVILIDSSPSLSPEQLSDSLTFVHGLVDRLDIGPDTTHVTILTYNAEVLVYYSFKDEQDLNSIHGNISTIQQSSSSGSNLPLALAKVSFEYLTTDAGNRPHFPDVLVLVTGTRSDTSILLSRDLAGREKGKGTRFFAVLFGEATTDYGLEQMATANAEPSQRHLFTVVNGDRVQDQVDDVQHYICRDAQLCTETADLVFIIDASGSMSPGWSNLLALTQDIIRTLPVGEYNVRVGVITYSNYAYVNLTLDAIYDVDRLTEFVDTLRPHDKNTNTTGAIRLARTELFKGVKGDRSDVRNVICLVADGKATWEKEGLREEAQRAAKEGIQIYVVGVGSETDSEELAAIASDPDVAHLFEVKDAMGGMEHSIIMRWTECTSLHAPWDDAPAFDMRDFGFCDKPIDLAVVVDGSGSVGRTKFYQYLDYIREMLPRLQIEQQMTRVALVTYSTSVDVQFYLGNFTTLDEMMAEIDKSRFYHDTTDTASALRAVKERVFLPGDRPEAAKVLLLLSDGESDNPEETFRCANELRDHGITIVTVAFGSRKWLKVPALIGLASEPRERNAFISPAFLESLDIQPAVIDSLCNRMDECSVEPCGEYGQCKDGIMDYTCTCHEGHAGKQCDQTCNLNLDLVFALDSSGTIGEESFQLMVNFVKSLTRRLPFTDNPETSTRIGVVTFGSTSKVNLHLNDYTDKTSLLNALHFYYDTGSTNAADAIHNVTKMFEEENPIRAGNKNVAVMFLDGKSDDDAATFEAAVMSRDAGVHWLMVGVGHMYRYYELEGIASPPGGSSLMLVESFEELGSKEDAMFGMLCNTFDECISAPCQHGGSCVDGLNAYHCDCLPGHHGDSCEFSTPVGRDIVFLVDTSFEMRRYNLPILSEFLKGVIEQIHIGEDETGSHVGVVVFGAEAEVLIALDQYTSINDVLHIVEQLKYMGGKPDIGAAINFVNQQVFNFQGGDRESAPNNIVLLTYGTTVDSEAAVEASITSRIAGNTVIVAGVLDMLKHSLMYQSMASTQDMAMTLGGSVKAFRSAWQEVSDLLFDDTNMCIGVQCQNGGTCVPRPHDFWCECPASVTGRYCQRRCERRLDVAVVVDKSGSMQDHYPIAWRAAKTLAYGLNLRYSDSRLAYVTYANSARLHFNLETYASNSKAAVIEAITLDDVTGDTNVDAALTQLRDLFSDQGRTNARQVVVWFSDGKLEKGAANTVSNALRLRLDTNVEIYSVGTGTNINRLHLNGLASEPASEYRFDIPSESVLEEVIDELLDTICL